MVTKFTSVPETYNICFFQFGRPESNYFDVLFVWVEALCPSQQFFSQVGMFSKVEPVLSILAQGHNTLPLVKFEPTI